MLVNDDDVRDAGGSAALDELRENHGAPILGTRSGYDERDLLRKGRQAAAGVSTGSDEHLQSRRSAQTECTVCTQAQQCICFGPARLSDFCDTSSVQKTRGSVRNSRWLLSNVQKLLALGALCVTKHT